MGAKYSQLVQFSNNLKRLNDVQREEYIIGCIKEIAARLLAKLSERTPVGDYDDGRVGGTLRRGWTPLQKLQIKKKGNTYIIDIVNNVEYASYVEYGHRTRNHKGWVKGKFMLTVSANEVNEMLPQILETRLKKLLKEVVD